MYDANGTLSHDVHYTLTPAGSGSYTLTVTASEEWINAENRAFPVVIDPTVTNTFQIFDTYIFSTAPNANYNSVTLLPLNDNTIIYSKWLIPYLPDDAIITNASMHLMPINIGSNPISYGIYKMQEDWSSTSITWNSAEANMTNFGMSFSSYDDLAFASDAVRRKINITSLAKQWYANRASNYGIALKKTGGTNNNILIYSCEADSDKQMYFTVTYRLFEDGIYFIQNVATGKYMDVEGPSSAEGAIIQQWNFHGANQSKWRLTHDSNGNIKIQSVYSNRYITTNSTSSSVTQTGTLNDYSTWAFQQTDSGNYKIVCPTFPVRDNNTISAPSATSGNGADLVMTRYTDDSNYCDEWRLFRIKYTATVNNFYDKGYCIRYGETESVSKAKISSYMEAVHIRYWELFALSIDIGTVQYFNSAIDQCKGSVTSANIDTLCTCSINDPHTNRGSVISNFSSSHTGNSTTTNILWSCHRILSTATSGVVNENRSCSSGTSIYMLEISDSDRDRNSQGVLMHELNHQFGARDHYHEEDANGNCKFGDICSDCGSNPRDEKCIMNQSRQDITADTIICDDCIADILTHLNSHHLNQFP